ncbi:MAG: CvpA family protein [Burkholderiales bacterium]|nr:CvpA family protein [Burkholderiales bacterium]
MATLGWVDMVLLGVLALSVAVGLWRGLVFELMSLVGWLVAYVLAQAFSPQVGQHLPIGTPGSALHQGVAFAATFVAVLLLWAVLARLVRLLVHATPLTVLDRALGGGFGLLRGVLVLLAAATLIAFTPAARSQAWTASTGAGWLATALQGLKPVLPPEVARHLPA